MFLLLTVYMLQPIAQSHIRVLKIKSVRVYWHNSIRIGVKSCINITATSPLRNALTCSSPVAIYRQAHLLFGLVIMATADDRHIDYLFCMDDFLCLTASLSDRIAVHYGAFYCSLRQADKLRMLTFV